MITASKNNYLPLARKESCSGESVQVSLGAGVGETDFVEAEARADQFGMDSLLRYRGPQVETHVLDCVDESLLDERMRMAVQASGQFAHEIGVTTVMMFQPTLLQKKKLRNLKVGN